MNPAGNRKRASGCSGLLSAALLILATSAIIGWPFFIDARGTATPGVITEKREIVRTTYGVWFRQFEVTAAYSVPGQPMQHRAVCDVTEKTYDSLRRGNTIVVHYFRNLLIQPFLPATHLSPCTPQGAIGLSPADRWKLSIAVVALLVVLLLLKLQVRFAAWLLFLWLVLSVLLLVLPKAEPAPQKPIPTTATIAEIDDIDTVGEGADSEGIPLLRPYQVVLLTYAPEGMDTPVTAVDKIDEDSVPNLEQGQNVSIVYDAAHPRVARLTGGTRQFPMDAFITVVLCCLGLIAIAAIGGAIRHLFRPAKARRLQRGK